MMCGATTTRNFAAKGGLAGEQRGRGLHSRSAQGTLCLTLINEGASFIHAQLRALSA